MGSKFSKEDLLELSEVVGMMIEAKVETAVETSFENYRKNYFVEPELHYQDHFVLQTCRKNFARNQANHKLISELNKDGELEKSVSFSTKLQKREKLIVKTATRTTVVAVVVGGITYARDILETLANLIRHPS